MYLERRGTATLAALAVAAAVGSWLHGTPAAPSRAGAGREAKPSAVAERRNLDAREEWFLRQRTYPLKQIPKNALNRAFAQRAAVPEARTRVIGTTPFTAYATAFDSNVAPAWGRMSGRARDLAIDPTNANRLFLATASGGIWRSTDGGGSWTPVTDTQNSLASSAVAIDPQNVNTIYAGTGEGPSGAYYGVGILKSTNGGTSWTLNAGTTFNRHSISDILVHPTNSNIVLACAGTGSHTPGGGIPFDGASTGVFRSTDGGVTFTQTQGGNSICRNMVADPANFNNIYASITFTNPGIYKSTDGGVTFTRLTTGSAPTSNSRLEIGISGTGTTIYAGGKDTGNTTRIWKSTDSGANWTQLATAPDYCESQCGYDNAIAVDPNNANIAYFGGVPMYRTMDGGANFQQIGDSNSSTTRPLHVDHHILKYAPGSSTVLYNGNDGGIYRSNDANNAGTPSWTSLTGTSLATLQPYDVALHPTDANIMLAGFQDNGTELRTAANGSILSERCGGDGGSALIDHANGSIMYCSFASNGNTVPIQKSTNGGTSFPTDVSATLTGETPPFIAAIVMDPNTSTTLYTGAQRLWRSADGGASWAVRSASTDLTGGGGAQITEIAVARSNSNVIYVVTSDGKVQVSSDGGVTFTDRTAAPLPGRFATFVAVDPADAATAYVGYSGFNDGTPTAPGHIFKTTNSGAAWTNITGTLPDTPVNAIGIRRDTPAEIYAGTDVGLFLSTNGGTNWTKMTNGIPNAAVIDVETNPTTDLLVVATYGRSFFRATLSSTTPVELESFSVE